jgi:hypothetical protein
MTYLRRGTERHVHLVAVHHLRTLQHRQDVVFAVQILHVALALHHDEVVVP